MINEYLNSGYSVISEGKDFVTLEKKKSFNALLFLVLLLCGVFPALIYLVVFVSLKDKRVTLNKK